MKMDMYVSSKPSNQFPDLVCSAEAPPREENTKKHNDLHHIKFPPSNNISFIPVYAKKANEVSQGLARSRFSETSRQLIVGSPPLRPRVQNEKMPVGNSRLHFRRRSVGFEDITLNSCYSASSEKRIQNGSSAATDSSLFPNSLGSFDYENLSQGRNSLETLNQNSRVTLNENDKILRTNKIATNYKDKSSKRKSSLNRTDFVDFDVTCSGSIHGMKQNNQRNSSSDEGVDGKPPQPELSTSSKRKHCVSPAQTTPKFIEKKTDTAAPSHPYKTRSFLLPKTTNSKPKPRHNFKRALHLQKLSHSAGELETLTDFSDKIAKVCLSAQEFSPTVSPSTTLSLKSEAKNWPRLNDSVEKLPKWTANCVAAGNEHTVNDRIREDSTIDSCTMNKEESDIASRLMDIELSSHKSSTDKDGDMSCMLDAAGLVSEKELEELYISSEDTDSERKPNSILRRKLNGGRRELHGILKSTYPDEREFLPPRRIPASILKHHSSEERDCWPPTHHSILKKSTSEEDSDNPIRPILKFSTEEDSSSSGGSHRPRPILKKRTSFSEDCSIASYNGMEALKPILKKPISLGNEDQPRPILKSRRKSEDVRVASPECVAGRPRAYSADMGVKGCRKVETAPDL